MSEYTTFMIFVKTSLISTKLKILNWVRHDFIISRLDFIFNKMTRKFYCVVVISIWLKFGGYTFYRAKVAEVYVL